MTNQLRTRQIQYINNDVPPGAFFVLDRDRIARALRRVSEQTEDLPATEFFWTNRITWSGGLGEPRFVPRHAEDILLDTVPGLKSIPVWPPVQNRPPDRS